VSGRRRWSADVPSAKARGASRPARQPRHRFSFGVTLLATLVCANAALAQTGQGTGATPTLESHPGDAAMFSADWEVALASYQARLAEGEQNADLHYNMGLAAAHLDRLGWAAFHLRQATLLDRGDDEAEAALALIEAELRSRRGGNDAGETLTRGEPEDLAWLELFHGVSAGVVDVALVAFSWLAFGLLIRRRRLEAGFRRDAAFVVALLAIVLTLAALAYRIGAEATHERIVPGVVVSNRPMLYTGPDTQAPRASDPDLFEGAVVLIDEQRDEWVGVELANGRSGWLTSATIQPLYVPHR